MKATIGQDELNFSPVGKLEVYGDKILIALLTAAGAILGLLGTLGAAGIAAWASKRKTDSDRLKTFLENGLEAYALVNAENSKDIESLKAKIARVEDDNAGLRQDVEHLNGELSRVNTELDRVEVELARERTERERTERQLKIVLNAIRETLGPDTIELIRTRLDEESGGEDISLELERPDV